MASRIRWRCLSVRRIGAPGVEGLVPWLVATRAKADPGDAQRRGPGNSHPVRRHAMGDRRSGPVRPTSIARPKARGDRSMAGSSRCDRVASRKALAGLRPGRETGTAQRPPAAVVEGCLRCEGDGRSTRTIEGCCVFSAAPAAARAFSAAWHDLRDWQYAARRSRNATCLFGCNA